MKRKIVIAGGTGFIGRYFTQQFQEDGFEVPIISRDGKHHVPWDDDAGMMEAMEGAEVLINLAGKSVDCRYNEKNKRLILNSRVATTRRLQAVVNKCNIPPNLWINASSATIYRHSEEKAMDEKNGETGSGFSVDIVKAWEAAFFEKAGGATRKIALRISITLGKNGGVMKPYIHLVKYGLGGQQGNGNQMFSWIHIEDLYRIVRFVMKEIDMEGVYIAASPHPVRNHEFMRALRHRLKPLFYLPAPEFILKAGAFLIRTEPELVLKSRWVLPGRLRDKGFRFRYATIDEALEDILQ